MFEQTSDKPMMYAFCRGMRTKPLGKRRILDKKRLQQFFQIRICNASDVPFQFLVHFSNIPAADRKIIPCIILSGLYLADTFHIHLQRSLKTGYVSDNADIIKNFKRIDPLGIRFPDFCIHRACFILKNQILIGSSILGKRRLFVLTQENFINPFTFPKRFNIFHNLSCR